MRLPDVNLLLYAIDEESPSHDPAREWLEAALSGTEAIAFAWVVLLGFLRISTNPAAIEQPIQPGDALEHIDEWLAQPVATIVQPASTHVATLRRLLQPLGTAGNLTIDAISPRWRSSTAPSSAPPTTTSCASKAFAGPIHWLAEASPVAPS